jgi:hypothetical protein
MWQVLIMHDIAVNSFPLPSPIIKTCEFTPPGGLRDLSRA